jgi:regulator of replication initiation timing
MSTNEQYHNLIENIENKLRKISRRKSQCTRQIPENAYIHLTNSDLNKTLNDSIMKSVDETLKSKYPRTGHSGVSNRDNFCSFTAEKTPEIIQSNTKSSLQKMEDKYLNFKYPG